MGKWGITRKMMRRKGKVSRRRGMKKTLFKEKKQYPIEGVIKEKEEKQYWKVTFLQTQEM